MKRLSDGNDRKSSLLASMRMAPSTWGRSSSSIRLAAGPIAGGFLGKGKFAGFFGRGGGDATFDVRLCRADDLLLDSSSVDNVLSRGGR